MLDELPILYETTCQILSICLKEYLYAHFRLIHQMKIDIQNNLLSITIEQLNWQQIHERFNRKVIPINEQLFQLTITAKNFAEKLKTLPTIQISNLYNYDKVCFFFQIIFCYVNLLICS